MYNLGKDCHNWQGVSDQYQDEPHPYYRIMGRFACINDQGREGHRWCHRSPPERPRNSEFTRSPLQCMVLEARGHASLHGVLPSYAEEEHPVRAYCTYVRI